MLTTDQIKEIAEQIDCGFNCFINKNKNEILYPRGEYDDFWEPEDGEDAWEDERKKIDANPDDYLEIEKMESRDSFAVMEDFAHSVDSDKVKKELLNALSQKKPFARFKYAVDYSGDYRQLWFDFKAERMQEWVKEQVDSFNRGLNFEDDDDDE